MQGAIDKSIPTLRLPLFRRPPTHGDVVNIARLCERNKDRYIIQPWLLLDSNHIFSLRCFLAGSGPEYIRLNNEGKLIHPEWTLLIGPENAEQPVWVYSTRDIDLVLGLIMSEVEGHARAASQELSPLTLKNLPTMQAQSNATFTGQTTTNNQTAPASVQSAKTNSKSFTANTQPPEVGAFPGASSTAASVVHSTLDHRLLNDLPLKTGVPFTAEKSGVVLSGNVNGEELQNVIQSVERCQMNGALLIDRGLQQAAIFFREGTIIDATIQQGFATAEPVPDVRGDHAFLEILTWTSGTFTFDYSRKSFQMTISRKISTLLTEGVKLREYCEVLEKRSIEMDTYFAQSKPHLTPEEVQAIIKEGLPLGASWQMSTYNAVQDGCSLYELLKRQPMPKAIWVPVIYNLVTLNLIGPKIEIERQPEKAAAECLSLDEKAVARFAHDLMRPETGACDSAAFAYFVQRELFRFQQAGRLFCVLIIQARARTSKGSGSEPLSNDAVVACMQRLSAVTGPLDVLGHYQLLDFGIIFPETGELPDWNELFDGCRRQISWPPLPGMFNEEDLLLAMSVYCPDENGNLALKAKKSYPGQ